MEPKGSSSIELESWRINLRNPIDVVTARQRAREMARDIGFGTTDQTRIATAVSELARRVLEDQGALIFSTVREGPHRGLSCTCTGCTGLGAPGYSSGNGGQESLTAARQLMDSFELRLQRDGSAVIVVRKWVKG